MEKGAEEENQLTKYGGQSQGRIDNFLEDLRHQLTLRSGTKTLRGSFFLSKGELFYYLGTDREKAASIHQESPQVQRRRDVGKEKRKHAFWLGIADKLRKWKPKISISLFAK